MPEARRPIIEIAENEWSAECIGIDKNPIDEAGSHSPKQIELRPAPNQNLRFGDCPICNTRFFSWIQRPT